MLRTGTTISGKYKISTQPQNTASGSKNQQSIDRDKYQFIKLSNPALGKFFDSNSPFPGILDNPAINVIPKSKSECFLDKRTRNFNGDNLINDKTRTIPCEVSTTATSQENEVKCEVPPGKPYTASAVTVNKEISSTQPGQIDNEYNNLNPQSRTGSNDSPNASNHKRAPQGIIDSSRNFSYAPLLKNYRTRKKLFRMPKYIQNKAKAKTAQSFDVGTEKWATEQFSNRNFTSVINSINLTPMISSIHRDCSFDASTVLNNVNIRGLRKENAQATINIIANGKNIKYKPYIVIICTILRISALDRIETSLRSGKSADLHIDSFSTQWDKSQLLNDGYLLGNMLHCLTIATGSTFRQDFYQRALYLEVIDAIRENIYSTCKHLAFTQYDARKKWIALRVNLTSNQRQQKSTRTSPRHPSPTPNETTSTATRQISLRHNTTNIPVSESWQEFSTAPYPITPQTIHLVPSISALLKSWIIFDDDYAGIFTCIEPNQQLSYRQFHVVSSTISRIAALKQIYRHVTDEPSPTPASMMTTHQALCTFPDRLFNKIAQDYFAISESMQATKTSHPKKEQLLEVIFSIRAEFKDTASTLLTALHLESTTGTLYPNLTLEHPRPNTQTALPTSSVQQTAPERPTRSSPQAPLNPLAREWTPTPTTTAPPLPTTTRDSNLRTPANISKSIFGMQLYCTPTPDTLQLYHKVRPADALLTVPDFFLSPPIQRLLKDLPDKEVFYKIFEAIPRNAKLTPQVCTILVNTIWRQTRICHVCSALWQVSTDDRFIDRDQIVDCYDHFCGSEDTVLHNLLQDSLLTTPALAEKTVALRILESFITSLSSVACELLRSEYCDDEEPTEHTSQGTPQPQTTPTSVSLPEDLFEAFSEVFEELEPPADIPAMLNPDNTTTQPTHLPDSGGDRGPVGRSPILGGPGAWGGRVWAEPRIFCDRRAQNALNTDPEDPEDPHLSSKTTHTQDLASSSSATRDTLGSTVDPLTNPTGANAQNPEPNTTLQTLRAQNNHIPVPLTCSSPAPANDGRALNQYRRWTRTYTRAPYSRTAFHSAYTQTVLCIHLLVSLCIAITNHLTLTHAQTSIPQLFPPVICSYVYTQLLTTPGSDSLVRGRITS